MMKEGGPGSGPQGNGDDEDNPFDREPSDDELADIEKQFEAKGFESKDGKEIAVGKPSDVSKDQLVKDVYLGKDFLD